MRPSKTVSESRHETSELMMPGMANNLGHVFGGVVLGLVDRAAAVVAMRHAGQECVTVSIDRVDFREPIFAGELVMCEARVTFVGRTSMEIRVDVQSEDLLSGERRQTSTAYLTFVAVDKQGCPTEVPPLLYETEEEKREARAAEARRAKRLQGRGLETPGEIPQR